jgi:hypothetical protein
MTMALPHEERSRLQQSLDHGEANADQFYHANCSGKDAWKALLGALAPHATAVLDAPFLEYLSKEKPPPSLPGFQRFRDALRRLPMTGEKKVPLWFIDGLPGCGRAIAPLVAAEALDCGVLRLNGAELVAQRAIQDLYAIRLTVQKLARSLAPVVLWFDHLQDPLWTELDPESWLDLGEETPGIVIGTSREVPPNSDVRLLVIIFRHGI